MPADAQSNSRYRTSAVCALTTSDRGRASTQQANLVDIGSDGARIVSEVSYAIGSNLALTVEGFQMSPLAVAVRSNHGNTGSGYELELRLIDCTWPFQVFSSLTMLAHTPATKAATPPCLADLGLKLPCSTRDVEDAYNRLVRTVHPDKGGDVEAFVRLRGAYLEAIKLVGE